MPPLVIKLGLWFADAYQFGVFVRPSEQVRSQMRIATIPYVQLMVPQEDKKTNQIQFAGAPYDKKKFGAIKFSNLMRYLLSILQQCLVSQDCFRRFLVGAQRDLIESGDWDPKKFAKEPEQFQQKKEAHHDEFKPNKIFELTPDVQNYCPPSFLGLCVIAMIDGAPENDQKQKQLEILEKVNIANS